MAAAELLLSPFNGASSINSTPSFPAAFTGVVRKVAKMSNVTEKPMLRLRPLNFIIIRMSNFYIHFKAFQFMKFRDCNRLDWSKAAT